MVSRLGPFYMALSVGVGTVMRGISTWTASGESCLAFEAGRL
jgi:hypothetical protein